MKVLFGRVFGVGNAVMSIPAVKAIASVHGPVDVLVGAFPEDLGAFDVFTSLRSTHPGIVGEIFIGKAYGRYDVAVMSIPYDGRWENGVHFIADRVLDGRPRPDPSTFGFSSWLKHEAEYELENATQLGWTGGYGSYPDTSFYPAGSSSIEGEVYLGIGFKRSSDGIWDAKNWGAENFRKFCQVLPHLKFISTGVASDLQETGRYLMDLPNFRFECTSWSRSFYTMSRCRAYFGNDTGMMHVAASMEKPTLGLYAFDNLNVKNRPLMYGHKRFLRMPIEPDLAAEDFSELLGFSGLFNCRAPEIL